MKRRFSLRTMFLAMTLVCLAIASCQYEYRAPYYEARGYHMLRSRWICAGVVYTWPAKGFDRTYWPALAIFSPWGYVQIPGDYYRGGDGNWIGVVLGHS